MDRVQARLHAALHIQAWSLSVCSHTALAIALSEFESQFTSEEEEEEEGFYKFLPANTADRLCQSWQSCSNHHEI